MELKIISLPALTVVGLAYHGKNENEEIPQLWQDLMPRLQDIGARSQSSNAYGVIYGFDNETGVMDYLAGSRSRRSTIYPTA